MKDRIENSGGWTRGGFLLAVAVLFAGQAGLVLLFGERVKPIVTQTRPSGGLVVSPASLNQEALWKNFFVTDPTVFPSSAPRGFADQAWQRFQPRKYIRGEQAEPPAYLEFAASHPGADFAPTSPAAPQFVFQPDGRGSAPSEETVAFSAENESRQESSFRIKGALAAREIGTVAPLRAWNGTPATPVLTNSVVQFAVNRAGLVIAARIVSGSGLQEADNAALSAVWGMRFNPAGKDAPETAWDAADFYWKTVPAAATPPSGAVPGILRQN